MKKARTRILGGHVVRRCRRWIALALAPAAHADAGSPHTSGVNSVQGDGSVRFIRDSIALPTWSAWGTRGGEVVSAETAALGGGWGTLILLLHRTDKLYKERWHVRAVHMDDVVHTS